MMRQEEYAVSLGASEKKLCAEKKAGEANRGPSLVGRRENEAMNAEWLVNCGTDSAVTF